MARDDMFKKYQEAGADFLEEARTRAEEFLRELAKASGATQKQAQDAFDEMFEGSRKGTEQMISCDPHRDHLAAGAARSGDH